VKRFKNLGYSRLYTARRTAGGAQPPGLTRIVKIGDINPGVRESEETKTQVKIRDTHQQSSK